MIVLGESSFGSISVLSSVDHNSKNWLKERKQNPKLQLRQVLAFCSNLMLPTIMAIFVHVYMHVIYV